MDVVQSESLAEYAENLELFADQILDFAIYLLDPLGRIKSWNAGAERLYGYTAQEIIDCHFSVCYTPEDLAADQPHRALETAAQNGSSRQEGLRVRKDQTSFWASATITALKDKAGTLRGFAKLTHDITRHKTNETKYLALFVNSHDAVLLTRPADGAILKANAAAYHLFGYPEQELLAKRRDDLLDLTDPRFVDAWVERAETGAVAAEMTFIRSGEEQFEARVASKLFLDENRQEVSCTTIQDITQQKQVEEALRTREEQYRTLFTNMTEGFLVGEPILDPAGHPVDARFLEVNEGFYVQTGTPSTSIEGRRMRECFPQLEQSWIDRYAAVSRTGQPDRFNAYYADTRRHFDVYAFSPSPGRFAVLFRDITEQKRVEDELMTFKVFSDHSSEGNLIADAEGRIRYANRRLCERLGYSEEEMLRLHIQDITPNATEAMFAEVMERTKTGSMLPFESIRRRKDGSIFPVEISATALEVKGEWLLFAISRDITERKKAEEDLRQAMERTYHQANHDMLTGLANRAFFHDRLKETLAHAERDGHLVAIHLLDLDRFKAINDTLGHHIGDLLLQEVGKRIKSHVRTTDLVARLGGDEFVVIQTLLVEPAAAGVLAEKLVEELGSTYVLENQEVHSATSLGIAIFPIDAKLPEELIKCADLALYEAKHRGRFNYQFYHHDLGTAFLKAQQLELELRRALRENEFFLYYQPQFDLKNGRRITGIEALLRWQHPQRGLLAAAEFLPDAEHAKLMLPIGEWTLQTACRQHQAWVNAGLCVPLTLNLSAAQLCDPRLLETVKRILAETGLPASMLQLEMRESVLWDTKFSKSLLTQMKESGLRLALDDFGAEPTALATLAKFPLDAMKPGQRLVKRLPTHPREAALLAAIISLAHNLNIAVCADGVESDEQFAAVKAQGCDSAQGYWLSSPLDARRMKQLIDTELTH